MYQSSMEQDILGSLDSSKQQKGVEWFSILIVISK
jgi:hypothetical protein